MKFPNESQLRAVNCWFKRDKRAYNDDIVVAPGDRVAAGEEVRNGTEEVPDLRFHFGFGHC